MKRRTKQFVTACLIVAAVTGTGAVSARADYHGIPDKVTLAQSKRSVAQGKKFEVKAQTSPYDAEDDYICWEIVSGKSYVRFEDSDRTGDDMDFVAVSLRGHHQGICNRGKERLLSPEVRSFCQV